VLSQFRELREKASLSVNDAARLLGYSQRHVYRWDRGESLPRPHVINYLRLQLEKSWRPASDPSFTFIDLFAGIGGMRMGFEKAGGKCVFTSEWNKFSRATYDKNFELDHTIVGDITEVEARDVPAHDLLVAGFPCQPFSIAGVSKKNSLGRPHGFRCETQGTLFFDVARIIEHCRPAAFLLENVKNLVGHDKGNTFRVIMDTLQNELGYKVTARVIDARSLVPQHRERIFIVGFREDTGFDIDDVQFPPAGDGPRLESILHPEDGTEPVEQRFTSGPEAKVLDKYTLSPKLWKYLQDYSEKHRRKGNGFGFGKVDANDVARTLSARYFKDGSEILVDQGEGRRPRRLTPRECSRLMGFDGPGESNFIIPVSDTQAYKQFGNAVVVPVVTTIAQAMKEHIVTIARAPLQQQALDFARTG
jgi:DNA (cytosine-5)-methyltransferase 1